MLPWGTLGSSQPVGSSWGISLKCQGYLRLEPWWVSGSKMSGRKSGSPEHVSYGLRLSKQYPMVCSVIVARLLSRAGSGKVDLQQWIRQSERKHSCDSTRDLSVLGRSHTFSVRYSHIPIPHKLFHQEIQQVPVGKTMRFGYRIVTVFWKFYLDVNNYSIKKTIQVSSLPLPVPLPDKEVEQFALMRFVVLLCRLSILTLTNIPQKCKLL